jgi:hypothetical protein
MSHVPRTQVPARLGVTPFGAPATASSGADVARIYRAFSPHGHGRSDPADFPARRDLARELPAVVNMRIDSFAMSKPRAVSPAGAFFFPNLFMMEAGRNPPVSARQNPAVPESTSDPP